MTLRARLGLAALVVAVDLVAFAIPLCALAIAWILVSRPPAFLRWVLRLYDDGARALPVAGAAGP